MHALHLPVLTVLRLSVSIFKVVRGKQGWVLGVGGRGDDRLSGNSWELGVPLKTLLTGSAASRGKAGKKTAAFTSLPMGGPVMASVTVF